ncbi:MAG: ABC-2 family transporter protein [Polyangiaceae bacterium]|jgi:viologen exporter family transport system permease protein
MKKKAKERIEIMSSPFGSLRFCRALLATNLRSALALRGSFWLQALFMVLNNVTFFVFWWVLFARVPTLRGFRLGDMEALFGITAASFGLVQVLAGGVRHLSRFIDEGALDTLLAQPQPVLLYALGMRSQPSGLGDLASGIGFLALSGQVRLATLPLVALAVLAAALVFLGCGVAFFSLAFWLPGTETLSRQLWDLTITFSLYPEPLFGGMLRLLLFTLLPAGLIGFLPLRVVRAATLSDGLLLALGAATYLALGAWFFGRGLKRYASGSRFGVFG